MLNFGNSIVKKVPKVHSYCAISRNPVPIVTFDHTVLQLFSEITQQGCFEHKTYLTHMSCHLLCYNQSYSSFRPVGLAVLHGKSFNTEHYS